MLLGEKFSPATALATGTSANQADRFWQDEGRTITSGNNEDIDLYDFGTLDIGAGAGLSPLGQAQTWAELVAILVRNTAASAGDLHVGGNGTAAAFNSFFNADDSAVVVVNPGGMFMLFAPDDPAYAITDTSNHLLRMAASGGNVTYDLYLMGRSA